MKKIVKILVLVLVFAILSILIAFALKQKNYISVEEMSSLSKSIYDYKNIHIYEIETSNEWNSYRVHDTFIKDDKQFVKSSGYNVGNISYTDKSAKEVITIVDAEQNIFVYSVDVDDKYYDSNPLLQKEDESTYTYLKDRYKYKGTDIINSKECFCFEIVDTAFNSKQTYWIYKDTGLLAKFEQIAAKPDTDEKQIHTYIDLYEFDTVTDDDVKRPNLQEYENAGYELIDKHNHQ